MPDDDGEPTLVATYPDGYEPPPPPDDLDRSWKYPTKEGKDDD